MIIPGILESDLEEVKKKIAIIDAVAPLIQIDIIDGSFVEGWTCQNLDEINKITTPTLFEIDLMVDNPLPFLGTRYKKVTSFLSHIEAKNVNEFIRTSKRHGYRTGVSLNPETPLERIGPYINHIDYVQFMTVHPGGSGREFLPNVIDKIRQFKQLYPNMAVQTDGANNRFTIPLLLQAGVERFAVTSGIFGSDDPKTEKLALDKLLL